MPPRIKGSRAVHSDGPRTKEGKQRRVAKVMREFYEDELHSSSGDKVTNLAQAKAIAMSEAGMSKRKKRCFLMESYDVI